MKLYRVSVSLNIGSGFVYLIECPSISDAARTVRHWDNVTIKRVMPCSRLR